MEDKTGKWLPTLAPKGFELFNCFKRYILIHGPRRTGKSISAMFKLVRHAWENEATVGIIAKTIRNAKAGVWTNDLLKLVIPQWVNAGIGFEITKPESMTADSKMTYFRVRNMYGTESQFELHSLDYAKDAEEKFRGTRFSAAYMSEADQFEDRIVFDTLRQQLRMPHVPDEQHLLICDTNPPEDGTDHWLHQVFMEPPSDVLSEFPDYFDDIAVIQFMLEDNPFISEKIKRDVRMTYAHDPNQKARLVDGLWIRDKRNSVFSDVLLPNVHFIGDVESSDPDEWEVLTPSENCFEFLTGWDLGSTANHAAVIACPRIVGESTVYDVVDELAYTKSRVSIENFTYEFLEKMFKWEDFMKSEYGKDKIMWRHWSDNSAFQYRSASDSTEQLQVRATSRGKIVLNAVMKGAGSIAQRKDLLRNLLYHNKIFFSRNLTDTIAMLEELKKGTRVTDAVDKTSVHKHVFDALTYMLIHESPFDVARQAAPQTRSQGIISIKL